MLGSKIPLLIQFADTLLDASFDEPLKLIDDLVGAKLCWDDGGDNEP